MLNVLRRNLVLVVSTLILLATPLAVPAIASAQTIQDCVSQGSGLTIAPGAACTPTTTANGTTKINTLVTDIVNVFSLVVGIISVIMIVFGGFQYITSGGDTSKVSTAKTTIIYAVVGLIVVAFAQFIVQFVLNKVVGTA